MPIKLELIISKFSQGKGIWKLNNSHLKNPEYHQDTFQTKKVGALLKKTVRRVKIGNNLVIRNQERISEEMQKYYSRLFENRDDKLETVDFEELGTQAPIKRRGTLVAL